MAGSATLAAAHRSVGCERNADEARCDRGLQAVTHGHVQICSAARRHCRPPRPARCPAGPAACTARPWRGAEVRARPGIVPASGIRDPARAVQPSRPLTSAEKQARPLRPVIPALDRGGWPPNRGPYGLDRTAGRPCGTVVRPAATGGTGFSSGNPPRWYRALTLAGWAHQPAHSVLRPARSDRPGPVVRLPERGWVRESGLAPRHGAPGGRNPDLVTNDTVPGDRHRINQRIESHRRLPGVTITVSQDADGRRLSSAASPPGHARPPGVPGELPEITGPPHHVAPRRAPHRRRSPGSGEPTGISRNGPRIPLPAERRTTAVRYAHTSRRRITIPAGMLT